MQSVMCLTVDPGVVSLILARSHTFVEIDHEIISMVILLHSAALGILGSCRNQNNAHASARGPENCYAFHKLA